MLNPFKIILGFVWGIFTFCYGAIVILILTGLFFWFSNNLIDCLLKYLKY